MSTMGYVTTLIGAEDAASFNSDFKNQSYKIQGATKSFTDLFTVSRSTAGSR